MMRIILIAGVLVLSACMTTAEERAECERMERAMGVHTSHDHQATKGAGGRPMNLTHQRCQRVLGRH